MSRSRLSRRVVSSGRKGPSRFFRAQVRAASNSEISPVASASFSVSTSSGTPLSRSFCAITRALRPEARSDCAFIWAKAASFSRPLRCSFSTSESTQPTASFRSPPWTRSDRSTLRSSTRRTPSTVAAYRLR